MNKVILIGNLTRDPDLTKTEKYTFCKFGLAVRRDNDKVDFFDITAWGKTAELCHRYLVKGKKVAIVGKIVVNAYDKDGRTIKFYEITADEVEFLSPAEEKRRETRT